MEQLRAPATHQSAECLRTLKINKRGSKKGDEVLNVVLQHERCGAADVLIGGLNDWMIGLESRPKSLHQLVWLMQQSGNISSQSNLLGPRALQK